MKLIIVKVSAFLLLLMPALRANPAAPLTPNETARFLAGFKTGKVEEENSVASKMYRASFDQSWKQLERSRLSLMRLWAIKNLEPLRGESLPIFYPFSGPDFVHVYTFFPNGSVYVLGGLEPVGSLPDVRSINSEGISNMYHEIQTSLTTSLIASFFKTNDMKKDLTQAQLNGVVPLLAIFMARSGVTIQEITNVHLSHDGTIQPANERINGVKIVFQKEGHSPQTLYYFQVDVSDDGTKGPSVPALISMLGTGITYLKSASYLMHRDGFSVIRSALLKTSAGLLEDDSGIPLRFFPPKQWNIAIYGNYVAPIDLFAQRFQPDLKALYDRPPKPDLLPFGIGYKYRREESMLMWAVRTNVK